MATFRKPELFTPAVGARGMTELHFASSRDALEAPLVELGARTPEDPVPGGGSDE